MLPLLNVALLNLCGQYKDGNFRAYWNTLPTTLLNCRSISGAGNLPRPDLPPIACFSPFNQTGKLHFHLWGNVFQRKDLLRKILNRASQKSQKVVLNLEATVTRNQNRWVVFSFFSTQKNDIKWKGFFSDKIHKQPFNMKEPPISIDLF